MSSRYYFAWILTPQQKLKYCDLKTVSTFQNLHSIFPNTYKRFPCFKATKLFKIIGASGLETEIVSQCGNLSILIMVVWIRDISCKATKCVNQNNLSTSRQKKIYDGRVDTLVRLDHICLLPVTHPLLVDSWCNLHPARSNFRFDRFVSVQSHVAFDFLALLWFRSSHVNMSWSYVPVFKPRLCLELFPRPHFAITWIWKDQKTKDMQNRKKFDP
jgi:hypothetical protein